MKKLIIIIAAIFVLVAGAATGVAIYSNQPKVVARNAVIGAISNFFERNEIEPFADMLDGGSLELDANVDLGIFESVLASGKIYFSDDSLMIKGFKAKTGELDFSADAYFSHDLSYVTNDDVLGGSYGIIRGEMAGTFKSNSFWRTKLLTKEQIDKLDALFASYDGGEDEDFEDDIEKYLKILIKSFEENATYTTATENTEIDGKQASVRAVYVSVDEKGALEIARVLCNELKNDSELREDLSGYGASFYNEMISGLDKFIENGQTGDGEVLNIKITTPKLSARLIRLEILNSDERKLALDVGRKGIRKADKITVKLGKETTVEWSVDRKNDTFKLCVPTNDIEISGGLVKKGKALTVTPEFIRLGDVSVKDPEIVFVVKGKDRMPTPLKKDEVKTIFEFPSNDLKDLLYRLGIDVPDDPETGGPGEGFLGDDDEID